MKSGVYKPDWQAAKQSIEAALSAITARVEIPVGRALGRRAGNALVAPHAYPQGQLAGMDGKAVDDRGAFVSGLLGTGEPVPEGTVRVVPAEELDGQGVVATAQADRSFVAQPGSEYAAGGVIVEPGQVLDAACVSQLALFGFERVEVLRKPVIRVLVCGDGARGPAVSAWLCGFLEDLGDVEVVAGGLTSPAGLAKVAAGADLVLLASDTDPGRYGEMRRDLYDAPVPGWTPGFWKVGLHPCKHVGFGFAGDHVPVLVFPDVLSKTVLSALVFAPLAVDRLLGRQPRCLECKLTAELELGGPFPEAVPVRVEVQEGVVMARPLPVRDSFSARRVAPSNGVIIARGPYDPDHGYRVRFGGGRTDDSV